MLTQVKVNASCLIDTTNSQQCIMHFDSFVKYNDVPMVHIINMF